MKKCYRKQILLLIIAVSISVFVKQTRGESFQAEKESLIKGDVVERQKAMLTLRDKGKSAIPVLCDVIENEKNYAAKQRAAGILDEILKNTTTHDEETLSILQRIVENSDAGTSNLGAMAVMQYKGNLRARRILREAIKLQKAEQIKAQVLGAYMVNIEGDKAEIPFLAEFLNDKSEYVRVVASGYLGNLGDKRGLNICKEVLERKPVNDQIKILQMRAAIAAGSIGDTSLIPILKTVAASRDYGLAQWQARTAVKEIELNSIQGKSERLKYLKIALSENDNVRWAVQKLVTMNDSDSLKILEWAAKENGLAGAQESSLVLSAIKRAKEK